LIYSDILEQVPNWKLMDDLMEHSNLPRTLTCMHAILPGYTFHAQLCIGSFFLGKATTLLGKDISYTTAYAYGNKRHMQHQAIRSPRT
jgi:hypothetical protein